MIVLIVFGVFGTIHLFITGTIKICWVFFEGALWDGSVQGFVALTFGKVAEIFIKRWRFFVLGSLLIFAWVVLIWIIFLIFVLSIPLIIIFPFPVYLSLSLTIHLSWIDIYDLLNDLLNRSLNDFLNSDGHFDFLNTFYKDRFLFNLTNFFQPTYLLDDDLIIQLRNLLEIKNIDNFSIQFL